MSTRFNYTLGRRDEVVLPKDLYQEQTDVSQSVLSAYDYVPFISEGYIEHLNALTTNSATAQKIINAVADYTIGEGFRVAQSRNILGDEKTIELSDEQITALHDVLSRVNTDGDNLLEICRKAAYDFEAFGNVFAEMEVVNSSFGSTVFLSHTRTNFVRPHREADLKTRKFGISLDWAVTPLDLRQNYAEFKDKNKLPYEVYDVSAWPIWKDQRTLLHARKYAPQMYFWGLPSWTGAKHWVELEYRIAKFNISKFRNGLTASGILQLFGDVNDQDKAEYVRDIRQKFTDTGNDFKVLIQMLDDPGQKANFIPFEQSYQGFFMELGKLCKEFIAIGYDFPLSLIQSEAGQLGSNQQIRSEVELLYNTKIRQIQTAILNKIVRPYLDTIAEAEGMEWLKDVELEFANIIPVSFKGDLEFKDYATVNEGRKQLGLPELEETEMTTTEEQETEVDISAMAKFINFFKRKR